MYKSKIISCLLIVSISFLSCNYTVNASYESDRQNIYDYKEFFDHLFPDEEKAIELSDISSDAYWWPIGSTDTTSSNGVTYAIGDPEETVITSYFGYRDAVYDSSGNQISGGKGHGALDIANTTGVGVTNIIASKAGVVIYPTAGDTTSCADGGDYNCGGGYGNYVVIQHTDGNYTLYGHLANNSITVKAGDSVSQGQVIGKMGTSGNSSGTHLHFEIRVGEDTHAARVDPLEYVSMENPRPKPSGATSNLYEFLKYFEGTGPTNGDNYVAYNLGDGVTTIGMGVTWENHMGRFKKHGITSISAGTEVSKTIVDAIAMEIIDEYANSIKSILSSNGVTLKQHQIDALTSRMYNTGNIEGFCDAYKQYGETDALYNNYMSSPIMPGTEFEGGLRKRRKAEWDLFKTGNYSVGG